VVEGSGIPAKAGASGFLLKDAGPSLLIEAVRTAQAGDALISPSVTVRLLQQLVPVRRPRGPEPTQLLSERELEITRIQEKLDVRNRVEIAAWSWEHHITDPT
jgi:DNA-binding NarL/FixJ family response regulator